MSSDTPSDPDGKGRVRRFLAEFFRDLSFSDWVEFLLYAAGAVAVVVIGIAWLLGLF